MKRLRKILADEGLVRTAQPRFTGAQLDLMRDFKGDDGRGKALRQTYRETTLKKLIEAGLLKLWVDRTEVHWVKLTKHGVLYSNRQEVDWAKAARDGAKNLAEMEEDDRAWFARSLDDRMGRLANRYDHAKNRCGYSSTSSGSS